MLAQTDRLFVSIILILFIGCCLITLGQRSKDCDNPPGGRITCETTQAAVCKVKDGKVDGYCITPPKARTEFEVLANLLTFILEKQVKPKEITAEQMAIVKRGYAFESWGVVTFSLPDLSAYVDDDPNPFRPEQPNPKPKPIERIRPPKR